MAQFRVTGYAKEFGRESSSKGFRYEMLFGKSFFTKAENTSIASPWYFQGLPPLSMPNEPVEKLISASENDVFGGT